MRYTPLALCVIGCIGEGETVTANYHDAAVDACAISDDKGALGCVEDAGTDAPTDPCDTDAVIASCEWCKANGCKMAGIEPEQCYSGVVHYTDMLGCLQADGPQANCPPCAGITFGMPITEECASCAAPFTPCSLSCAFEASGGK